MKKIINTVLVLAIATTFVAFTNPIKEKKTVKESTITWVGKKVTGSHEGTIDLKEGYLEFEKDQIVGGKFVIDMTSITVTDLEGKSKGNLEGHLNSDDFFGTSNYPTATLVVKEAQKIRGMYKISGDITIKGTTEPIAFDLVMEGNTGTTKLTIDRTKFGIRYGSGSFFDNLGDKAINDEFTLDVTLKM